MYHTNSDLTNSNLLDEEQSNLLTEVIAQKGLKKDLASLTGCKRPTFNVGKKKRAYQKCLADYKAKIASQNDAVAQAELKVAQAKEEAEQAKKEAEQAKSSEKSSDKMEDSDKILGMPKMVAYGLGVLIIGVAGFLIYKKVNK